MKRHTFDEVSRFDESLYQLALYAVTEGKIYIPKTTREMFKLQEKVADKFNYFKKLIHDGECTLDFIEQDVLSTYGPFPREERGEDFDPEEATNYIREIEEREAKRENNRKQVQDILGSLLESFQRYEDTLGGYQNYDYDKDGNPFHEDKRNDEDSSAENLEE